MAGTIDSAVRQQRALGPFVAIAVLLGLAGLPLAVWLDLRGLSERLLRLQASEIGSIIDDMRGFYAKDVVGRVLQAHGEVSTGGHDFRDRPGAIPIPATLSIELGNLISSHDGSVRYRFVSDLPFRGREHSLDGFEQDALARLRADPAQPVVAVTGTLLDRQVRMATPVKMGEVCVGCHNTHPDSPKQDWKVGDVRGIQEISVAQPLGANLLTFKYLMAYFVLAGAAGLAFILMQRRQARLIRGMNQELTQANEFLATISMKLAKYLSPQIYKSIFSGKKDVAINTERKKLTIFFSDIVDFTQTTDELESEELTSLLNRYLTEMAKIALEHGATVDKYVGDAILAFFGDPDTRGVRQDALACVRMAVAMQRRMADLRAEWLDAGLEKPFRLRIGINTGFCTVGNFGSEARMDYTIIGGAVNLAARLQAHTDPGSILLSHETWSLVRDAIAADEQAPLELKGFAKPVRCYRVRESGDAAAADSRLIRAEQDGLRLQLDLDRLEPEAAARVLEDVLARLRH